MKHIFVLAAVVSLAVFLVACGGPDLDTIEPVEGVTSVTVEDNRFESPVISVPAGTEVTWTWDASQAHNVVGDDGLKSDTIEEGEYRHTFATPGTYNYHCTLHGGMEGRVVVTGG